VTIRSCPPSLQNGAVCKQFNCTAVRWATTMHAKTMTGNNCTSRIRIFYFLCYIGNQNLLLASTKLLYSFRSIVSFNRFVSSVSETSFSTLSNNRCSALSLSPWSLFCWVSDQDISYDTFTSPPDNMRVRITVDFIILIRRLASLIRLGLTVDIVNSKVNISKNRH
jgi:hypothetical protein